MVGRTRMDEIERLGEHLASSRCSVAITGAGISLSAGIGAIDARTLPDAEKVISISHLRDAPASYYAAARRWFLEPMFTSGPTPSHRALARLEDQGRVHGIVTTNLDHLHTLAGSRNVAEIQGSFAVNVCLDCGRRVDDVHIWNQGAAPSCPDCAGPLAPYPTSSGVGLLAEDVEKARQWVRRAELVVVIGTTGPYGMAYLDALAPETTLVQINPRRTSFDRLAALNIRRPSDDVLSAVTALA